jgi:protein OS-9
MMRRQQALLLAALQLCGARSTGFSAHQDLLAFPQFEVVLSDKWISEKDAHLLLQSDGPEAKHSTDLAKPTDSSSVSADDDDATKRTYEIMSMSPYRYLCSIPVVEQDVSTNQTANELAKAEEAKELTRATESGWELLNELEESCLYFMSGWWSYRFCKNREIVQFHALSSTPAGQPPRRDPQTAEYILGAVPSIPAAAQQRAREQPDLSPSPAELQVKGEQRYLIQRLEGGTICDLTGRERTIEVQYHCVPGLKQTKIAWIKEVTICAYLMVVNTPRLCSDVAFLPPDETTANAIECKLIVDDDSPPPLLDQSQPGGVPRGAAGQSETTPNEQATVENLLKPKPVTVGGVVVGARNILSGGDEDGKPVKLNPPKNYLSQEEKRAVQLVAQAASKKDGGGFEVLSAEELEELEIDPEVIEEMRQEMEKLVGDSSWRLEIVELPNGDGDRELRAYVDVDPEGQDGEEKRGDTGPEDAQGDDGSEEKFFNKDEL